MATEPISLYVTMLGMSSSYKCAIEHHLQSRQDSSSIRWQRGKQQQQRQTEQKAVRLQECCPQAYFPLTVIAGELAHSSAVSGCGRGGTVWACKRILFCRELQHQWASYYYYIQ